MQRLSLSVNHSNRKPVYTACKGPAYRPVVRCRPWPFDIALALREAAAPSAAQLESNNINFGRKNGFQYFIIIHWKDKALVSDWLPTSGAAGTVSHEREIHMSS